MIVLALVTEKAGTSEELAAGFRGSGQGNKKNFEGVSEIVRKIRIREYVQNRIVLLYEGHT